MDEITSILEAVGTVAAVIVALFIQVFMVWRKRPMLTMALSDRIDDEDIVILRNHESSPTMIGLWVRLRVYAKNNRRTAHGAQVRLVKVKRLSEDPIQIPVPSGPMAWASTGPQPQSILPGMWLRLDVIFYRVKWPDYARQLEVEVGYEFRPNDIQTVLAGAGRYEITMLLGADDCETSTWSFTFDHVPDPSAVTDEDIIAMVQNLRLVRL